MQIYFLGHGLKPNSKKSVGNLIIKWLQNSDIHTFTCFVAFASKVAINGISDLIIKAKDHIKDFNFFIGVDLKGTSKEALEELLLLKVNSYIYYTNTDIIYHPKIYIFEGQKKCMIIIGSSNLTKPGLFSHIESSIVIEFERKDKDGEKLLDEIKDYYKNFLNGENINVKKLNNRLINKLVSLRIVPNETESQKINNKRHIETDNELKEIRKLFPKIKTQKPSPLFKKKNLSKITKTPKTKFNQKGDILWIKRNLPGSDVQISRSGTNPTGCLRLTQANFFVNDSIIDQTKYFRNDIFGNVEWIKEKQEPYVEIAQVKFLIKILGKTIGEYELEIRHKPSGESKQHNYTTSISWGELSNIIQRKDLRGRSLYIYRPSAERNEPFFLEIL